MGWTASILMLSPGSDHERVSLLIFPTKLTMWFFISWNISCASVYNLTLMRRRIQLKKMSTLLHLRLTWVLYTTRQSALDKPKFQNGVIFGVCKYFSDMPQFLSHNNKRTHTSECSSLFYKALVLRDASLFPFSIRSNSSSWIIRSGLRWRWHIASEIGLYGEYAKKVFGVDMFCVLASSVITAIRRFHLSWRNHSLQVKNSFIITKPSILSVNIFIRWRINGVELKRSNAWCCFSVHSRHKFS